MATSYYDQIKKDSGLKPVNAKELQSKFDAITEAEYDKQRTELQTTTNKYYNQLYDTQQTTMDTIRQANAQAVASGASKGVQAANELSALLGLQSEAVTGATDLANQATTLAQDETQAMLDNMLNAETQAAEQNQALAQILTQAGSVDVEQQNAETALLQTIETIKQTNPDLATTLMQQYNRQYADDPDAAQMSIINKSTAPTSILNSADIGAYLNTLGIADEHDAQEIINEINKRMETDGIKVQQLKNADSGLIASLRDYIFSQYQAQVLAEYKNKAVTRYSKTTK